MNCSTSIITSAALAFAGLLSLSANAVEYFPPEGTGYWQLQELQNDATVCETFQGVCDVPPGVYRLIDLDTMPATRSLVTIEGLPPEVGNEIRFVIESHQTDSPAYLDTPVVSFEPSCSVDNAQAIAASCTARDSATGEALPLESLSPSENENGWTCVAPRLAQIQMHLTCAESDS